MEDTDFARKARSAAGIIREVLEALYAHPELRRFWIDERIVVARAAEKWLLEQADLSVAAWPKCGECGSMAVWCVRHDCDDANCRAESRYRCEKHLEVGKGEIEERLDGV